MRADRPIALVTGGTRRVGLSTACVLARAGCDVVITYRSRRDEAEEAARTIGGHGAAVMIQRADLDDMADVESLGAWAARTAPRLDVLVHNASVYESGALGTVTADDALRAYRVNALAPLLLTQQLRTRLSESPLPHGGAVVAMVDIHAMGRPRRGMAAYTMSKGALTELVGVLARELAPRVRVNGVAPGVVAFPDQGPEADESVRQAYLRRVPLGRSGTPEEAAEVVRWLALDAGYVTGTIVRIDGGRWLA